MYLILKLFKNSTLGVVLVLASIIAPSALAAPTYMSADFTGGLFSVGNTFKANLSAAGYDSSIFNCSSCANPTSVTGHLIFDASLPIQPTGFDNVFSIGAITDVANADIFGINIDGIGLHFGDTGIQGGPAIQYNNGVFNGFFFVDDFSSPNATPLELSIQGGTFSLYRTSDFANLLTGFINIGANGLTNVQDFTPTSNVPEPETYAMMLMGLCMMGFVALRRDNQQV
jgi:hypothetical protein